MDTTPSPKGVALTAHVQSVITVERSKMKAKKPIIISKSTINFLNDYPKEKCITALFQLPKKSRILQLHFNTEGRLISFTVSYEGKL